MVVVVVVVVGAEVRKEALGKKGLAAGKSAARAVIRGS